MSVKRESLRTLDSTEENQAGSRSHVQLPVLPSSWEYKRFGQSLDIQGGSQPPKSTFAYEPTPGYIQLLQIRDFGERSVPTFVLESSVSKRCTRDDILIARYGASLGRILTGESGAYNVALAKVIFDQSQFYNRYLYYLLQTPFFQIPIHMISRSAQNGFNKSDLSDIWLPIAPVEQKRIVAEIEKQFTRLEAGTAALRRVQANLKRYRAAVLKAACEGRLVPTEAELAKTEKRKAKFETGEQLLARILKERREKWAGRGKYQEPAMPDSSSVTSLPQGWSLACLAQLAAHITDGTHKTPIYVTDGVPFLSAKDISGFRISFDNCRFISQSEHEMLRKRCAVRRGNVLITKSGTIGRVAVVETDQEFSLFESVANIPVISPIEPKYVSFASFVAVSGTFGAANQKGVAVRHLHLEDLRRVPIPLPPLAEQTRIVTEVERRLSVIEGLEAMVAANLQRAARLRQAVLLRAFSGQL